eukprot:1146668-Pelagomonas_calceolata.AAC.1
MKCTGADRSRITWCMTKSEKNKPGSDFGTRKLGLPNNERRHGREEGVPRNRAQWSVGSEKTAPNLSDVMMICEYVEQVEAKRQHQARKEDPENADEQSIEQVAASVQEDRQQAFDNSYINFWARAANRHSMLSSALSQSVLFKSRKKCRTTCALATLLELLICPNCLGK